MLKVVNSHTEWAKLEEIIVGDLKGSRTPYGEPYYYNSAPVEIAEPFRKCDGKYIKIKKFFKLKAGKKPSLIAFK